MIMMVFIHYKKQVAYNK